MKKKSRIVSNAAILSSSLIMPSMYRDYLAYLVRYLNCKTMNYFFKLQIEVLIFSLFIRHFSCLFSSYAFYMFSFSFGQKRCVFFWGGAIAF